jgi:hypothetical protein
MIAKTSGTYNGEFFTAGKVLRDHGITESGVVSRVTKDADDICVSAVNAAQRRQRGSARASAESATSAAG